jgi:hypothetical protein
MNTSLIGGTLVVGALGAILFLHGCDRHHTPAAKPVPKAAITASAPKIEPPLPAPVPLPTPAPKKKATPKTYHKVLPGGKLDPSSTVCNQVRDYTAGMTPAQIDALAAKYKVSSDDLAKYKACLN